MFRWVKELLCRKANSQVTDQLLLLQGQIQALHLDGVKKDELINKLKTDIENQRRSETNQLEETVKSQIESVFFDLATPVSQIQTQTFLINEGKPVQIKDVLRVCGRIVRTLEDYGMNVEGKIGELASFSPDLHDPLGSDVTFSTGETVIIRFAGISYRGKLLRKALVSSASNEQFHIKI